jgi:hypothetical protein
MKNISTILNTLKVLVKYSAYIIVVFDVLNYAIERIEALSQNEKKITDKTS